MKFNDHTSLGHANGYRPCFAFDNVELGDGVRERGTTHVFYSQDCRRAHTATMLFRTEQNNTSVTELLRYDDGLYVMRDPQQASRTRSRKVLPFPMMEHKTSTSKDSCIVPPSIIYHYVLLLLSLIRCKMSTKALRCKHIKRLIRAYVMIGVRHPIRERRAGGAHWRGRAGAGRACSFPVFCPNYFSHAALLASTAFESYLLPEIRLMWPLFYLSQPLKFAEANFYPPAKGRNSLRASRSALPGAELRNKNNLSCFAIRAIRSLRRLLAFLRCRIKFALARINNVNDRNKCRDKQRIRIVNFNFDI
ncbi:hypothetical protein EVAR_63624_1 [Eumeta japonica]|uniref:Uncharacterized protein n=1 Tax=Eumeta variegata TaxID=151549 RepID=A0A4C1ZRN3_EUMVA|nr:hypothetical protein EVAR_63624_1 [Eumeta japonica]